MWVHVGILITIGLGLDDDGCRTQINRTNGRLLDFVLGGHGRSVRCEADAVPREERALRVSERERAVSAAGHRQCAAVARAADARRSRHVLWRCERSRSDATRPLSTARDEPTGATIAQ